MADMNITERIMQIRAGNPKASFFDAAKEVEKEIGRKLTPQEEDSAQGAWIRTRDA